MIIEQIKLNNFGKFNNEVFLFPSKFSLIYGKNEDGKTTILDAVYLLFYGFKGQKTKDVRENIRKRYEPKNGSDWSGEVKFNDGDRSYILKRIFGKTNAGDIVTVIDDLTGKEIDIPKFQTPGEYFFDMSEQTFLKTVYINSSGSEISLSGKAGNELSNKLVNIVTSGDEAISYREALTTLTNEKRRLINGNNNGGLLYFAKKDYENLLIERQELFSGENEKKEALKYIEKLENELSVEENKRKQIIQKQEECYKRVEESDDGYTDLGKNNDEIYSKNSIEENEKNSEYNFKKNNVILKDLIRFIFVLVICIGLTVYTYFEHKIFLSMGFGILGFVLSVYEIYSLIKYKNSENSENNAVGNAHLNSNNYNDGTERYSVDKNNLNKIYEYGDVKNNEFNKNLIYELKNISDAEKESFGKIADLNREISETKAYINAKFSGKKTVASIDIEIDMKKKELRKYEKDYEAICIAEDALKKAYEKMEVKFKPKLNERTEEIFYEMTGKKVRIRMDELLNIYVEGNNETILSYDALSSGTIEQVYFALRLAITEFISEKNLPILSDDAFIFFDDENAENAIKFLIDYAGRKNKQILFFTCHQRFMKWVERYENTSILELSHDCR